MQPTNIAPATILLAAVLHRWSRGGSQFSRPARQPCRAQSHRSVPVRSSCRAEKRLEGDLVFHGDLWNSSNKYGHIVLDLDNLDDQIHWMFRSSMIIYTWFLWRNSQERGVSMSSPWLLFRGPNTSGLQESKLHVFPRCTGYLEGSRHDGTTVLLIGMVFPSKKKEG